MVPERGGALLNTAVKNQQNFALRSSGFEFPVKGRGALCSQHCPVPCRLLTRPLLCLQKMGGSFALAVLDEKGRTECVSFLWCHLSETTASVFF